MMKSVTVHADVKFHSQMPFTNVDVCFRNHAELQQLIVALQGLQAAATSETGVVLADPASYQPGAPAPEVDSLATAITFHAPAHRRDELDLRCLAAARAHLESLCANDEHPGENRDFSGGDWE